MVDKILKYRKSLSALVIVVITVIIAEATSPVFLYMLNGRWISRSEINSSLLKSEDLNHNGLSLSDNTPVWMRPHILHPYLGFVRNPDLKYHIFNGYIVDLPVNRLGFFGPLPKSSLDDERVSVAIMGGSVAFEFYLFGRELLYKQLKSIPEFENKDIEIISIALGGMKQPQQLMALNYLLTLGYDLDMVINLDGFNEVALTYTENIPSKVSPHYPRSWEAYSSKTFSGETVALAGAIYEKKKLIETWRGIASRKPFCYSNIVLALWYLFGQKLNSERIYLEEKIALSLGENKSPSAQTHGPPYVYEAEEDIFLDSVELWKNSSLQMWHLCKSNSIDYYHFLQPNQYAGQKKFTEWEQVYAFTDSVDGYGNGAEKGYKYLQLAGKKLKNEGVQFSDLTGIFRHIPETVYRDACCHYNKLGNDLLAERIAEVIVAGNGYSEHVSQGDEKSGKMLSPDNY